jgi:hypothetical protein
MAGTARKTGVLYGVLNSLSSGVAPFVDLGLDRTALVGRSARYVADHIAAAVSPSDGTQDAEASRESISRALGDLIREDPSVDLTALTEEQIDQVMESFIGHDICRRIELDVGKAILEKAPAPLTAMQRLDEMYRYVQQSVAAAFRQSRAVNQVLSQSAVVRLAAIVIRRTFAVFEEYLS